MIWQKKAGMVGLVISLLCLAFVLYHRKNFFTGGEYGSLLFVVSVAAAGTACPAIAIRPKASGRAYRMYLAMFFFAAPLLCEIVVERLNGNFIGELLYYNWIDNYVVILLFFLLAFALSGSVRISVMILAPLFLFFGTVNMYVKEFKGSPLVPMDVGSVATAMTVSGGYTYDIGLELAFAVALTVMICALACRLAMPKDEETRRWGDRRITSEAKVRRLALRIAALIFPVGFAILFYGTNVLVDLGYKPDFFNQVRGYEQKGAVLEFVVNTRYLRQSKPEGYDAGEIENLANMSVGEGDAVTEIFAAAQEKKGQEASAAKAPAAFPDIIVIMDEAFSDLSAIGEFSTDREYLPFFNSIRGDTIQGSAYVSVFGSGTSNTEFEFLTGNSMAFLPAGSNAYQLYVRDGQPGLVSTLTSQGYCAEAFHPYFRDNWNRPRVYEYMGFEEYIGIEELFGEAFVTAYAENSDRTYTLRSLLRQEGADEDVLLRKYVSDAYDFREVIRRYEQRDPGRPYFMFNVTMQNHSPYDLPWYDGKEAVHIRDGAESYPKTEQYLGIIRKTDAALEELITYFKKVKHPTIILFFGDHQPYIEGGFYKTVMGAMDSELTDEDQFKRYQTRFLLWANYEIPIGWVDQISMNYLSTLLLQMTGLKMPPYNKYLAELYPSLPVITAQGCYDAAGRFFAAEDASELPDEDQRQTSGFAILKDPRSLAERIRDYRCLAYNNVIDKQHRADAVFTLP